MAANFREASFEIAANFRGVQVQRNTISAGLKNEILCPVMRFMTIGKVMPSRTSVTDVYSINTEVVMDGASNPSLKRYVEDEQWIRSWREGGGRKREALFILWELTSHCGRSFVLWMFWALVVAVVFGTVYAGYTVPSWIPWPIKNLLVRVDPEVEVSPDSRTPTQFTPYYFSIVTFTTLGFGDISPLNLAGEVWLALEVIFGYLMLGGLISIFANKFARRG